MTEFFHGRVPQSPEELPKYLEEVFTRVEEAFSRNTDVQSFTPSVAASITPGTLNYNQQIGRYRITDKELRFNLYLDWDTWTGTGDMSIAGFPVPASSFAGGFTAVSFWHTGLIMTAGNVIQGYVGPSGSGIVLNQVPTGGGAAVTIPVNAAAIMLVAGSYFVD